jgi:GAF domain-containing protein
LHPVQTPGAAGQAQDVAAPSATLPSDDPEYVSDWALAMAELARELQSTVEDLDGTLAGITIGAVGIIPGVDFACVTVVTKEGEVSTLAATDPAAGKVNAVQQQAQQGPCLTALWQDPTVRAVDLSTETRWPVYTAAARELGIGGVMSVRLYVQDHVLGALSLYARSTEVLGDESMEIASMFAAHAAIAFAAAEEHAQLLAAIDSRDTIGQAKGILMERYKLTDRQAFSLLVKISQNTNIPLRQVVRQLTETGEIPQPPPTIR